jgi:AcrR family transcriptional regulator
VSAAIRIIDAEGADALSMRRLGVELGSGATSVYRHVRDKEELISLAFDAITGEIALPDAGTPWEEALVASAQGLRELFQRHQGFVLVIGRRAAIGPRTLELIERLLGILRAAEFADQDAYHAISAIANYATGFTVLEIVPGLRGAGGAGVPEYRELLHASLNRLPTDVYPNAAAVAPLMIGKEDEDFEYGVSAVVAGIRSLHAGRGAG